MIGLLGVGGFLKTVLDFLKSPVGMIVIAVLLYGVGYYRGGSSARERCEAEKQASIEAARQIDAKAQAEADARMREQIAAAQGREEAFRRQVDDYAKIAEQCTLKAGVDDPVISDPGGVPRDTIPGRAPVPPKRPGSSPAPRR